MDDKKHGPGILNLVTDNATVRSFNTSFFTNHAVKPIMCFSMLIAKT